MNGFNATTDFPGSYVKPKSGSAFFEQMWEITNNSSMYQLWYTRYFCYTDFCNPLSIVPEYLNLNISYQNFDLTENVTACLICKAPDYDTTKSCNNTQICTSCQITANQTQNDLYNLVDWSSRCNTRNTSLTATPLLFGEIIFQYEIETQLINIYTILISKYTFCSNFDFLKQFVKV